MDRPENKKRLEDIFSQLVKISNGNFSYQINRSDNDDILEALTFLTNSASEEIKDAFRHQAFVNLHNSYHLVVQMFFEINDSGQIIKTNYKVEELLGYDKTALLDTPFINLLTNDSRKGWKKLLKELNRSSISEMTVNLTFMEQSGLELPAHCHIIRFLNNTNNKERTIITSFDMVQNKGIKERKIKKKVELQLQDHKLLSKKMDKEEPLLNMVDFDNLRRVKDYILDNLDEPLPSIKTLAQLCWTNEYKFKRGFKELYAMTPFQYQKNERLRRAHLLIEHSNKTIGSIAKMVGFKKGNHLAREFKKKYGYSPTALRKSSK
ncbi:helix-turn-helix domain-containing protein [Flagellimonas marinaquae]|uniref:helix-turn-helix domain-containing protein n=1 Tax=Flagellimonas aurea TaxID=2915619 RepID=UPI001CE0FF60|nr:helix-turn-helix domain-containing protein [Allomuricauda aquimarina]